MDFGIAKIVSEAQSSGMSTMLGTPAYMAPEQWRMEEIDGRADLYSLGIMLYEMVTGNIPFNGQTPYHLMYSHLHEAPTLPSQIFPELSADIDAVVLKALAKDVDARYQTAGELATDLAAAIQAQERDTRRNLTSLEAGMEDIQGMDLSSQKSGILGSVLLALDRPSGRMYAVPKIDDFIQVVSTTPDRHKPDAVPQAVAKRFDSWRLDEILQELEQPARTTVNAKKLGQLLRESLQRQTYLGAECHPVTLPEKFARQVGHDKGLLVASVSPHSIAAKADLMLGDTLVRIDNIPLRTQDDLANLLSGDRVGKAIDVEFIRAGAIYKKTIALRDD
jgi:serine/threonine protein kinase